MHSIVIADTSCFILLDNINELELLHKLYPRIITTQIVANEFGKPLPQWVEVATPHEAHLKKVSSFPIDEGEITAIALAMNYLSAVLIIDDLKARKIAGKLGLPVKGTIGIIVEARLRKQIPSIKPLIEKINATNFRLSKKVFQAALKEAGEL